MSDYAFDEIVRTFDALAPGQAFVLNTEDDPRPLLRRLQAERARQFEWSLLEAGPGRYRVGIGRRASAASRAVAEYLGRDHDRLDALLGDVSRRAREGAYEDAARSFAEFACGLNWHIEAEEVTLFPTFEAKTGIREGPTAVLREEHRLIRRRMDDVATALRASDAKAIERAIAALGDILEDHNLKEEHVVYPMTDGAMTDATERDELVTRIQRT